MELDLGCRNSGRIEDSAQQRNKWSFGSIVQWHGKEKITRENHRKVMKTVMG